MTIDAAAVAFHDQAPGEESFRDAVLAGWPRPRSELPCKYFYDARGSALFEEICRLAEYYLTRTEVGDPRAAAAEIGRAAGAAVPADRVRQRQQPQDRILLDSPRAGRAYVPVDISREHLRAAGAALARISRAVRVTAAVRRLHAAASRCRRCRAATGGSVYFPGSTIGNFTPEEAVALPAHARDPRARRRAC